MNSTYPILEYDPTKQAIIEPSLVKKQYDVPEHCVICSFTEVIEKVIDEQKAKIIVENHWEDGHHNIYEMENGGRRLAFYHNAVGASLASALLEEAIAFGFRKFITCGGCGVLEGEIEVGQLIIVSAAIRDEGVSYHYMPAGREVRANEIGVAALQKVLTSRRLPFRLGKTWTTDAPYRETRTKLAARKKEGCIVVEMEAAGMMAVAEYRGVILGQMLYGGDNLSGVDWDHRGWHSKKEVRESMFWLSIDACLEL